MHVTYHRLRFAVALSGRQRMHYAIRVVFDDGRTEEMPDKELDLAIVCHRALCIADELERFSTAMSHSGIPTGRDF